MAPVMLIDQTGWQMILYPLRTGRLHSLSPDVA